MAGPRACRHRPPEGELCQNSRTQQLVECAKVLWCCDELGILFTREDYGSAFGKTTEAPYLELNPNSRVPTIIEDDTFVLWENNVIVRYLADKYGKGGLMPRDPRAHADADRWIVGSRPRC